MAMRIIAGVNEVLSVRLLQQCLVGTNSQYVTGVRAPSAIPGHQQCAARVLLWIVGAQDST
jgi:hypothetical protein